MVMHMSVKNIQQPPEGFRIGTRLVIGPQEAAIIEEAIQAGPESYVRATSCRHPEHGETFLVTGHAPKRRL